MNTKENITTAKPAESVRASRNSIARFDGRVAIKNQVRSALIVPKARAARPKRWGGSLGGFIAVMDVKRLRRKGRWHRSR